MGLDVAELHNLWEPKQHSFRDKLITRIVDVPAALARQCAMSIERLLYDGVCSVGGPLVLCGDSV
jgi:hypothetical protein